jgi:hypothetical protein
MMLEIGTYALVAIVVLLVLALAGDTILEYLNRKK